MREANVSEWFYEFKWNDKPLVPISSTNVFRIPELTPDRNGDYQCIAHHNSSEENRRSNRATLSVSAAAPRPVVTVSPSWLTPGASGTLTCGGGPHPTAGWRFYWYRADLISLDPSDMHTAEFSYELLPGSDGGTEQNSFVIRGLTESAGYACRAGRGDPVFYTKYSEKKWVWPVDSYSSVSLTVRPDSVQHFYHDLIRLTCEGNPAKWRLWRFTEYGVRVLECESQERITSFTWTFINLRSGVVWCESGSEISNAVNITTVDTYADVLLESPVHPVTGGQSVTLSCSWDGRNLDSSSSFYKNGELLQSDVRGKLEISAVSKSDEGFYKCEHSGDFSPESWMSVKLTPAAPPSTSPVPLVVGLVGGFTLILLLSLLLLCWCRSCDFLSEWELVSFWSHQCLLSHLLMSAVVYIISHMVALQL
ncbi:uncharacterized protein LOC133020354 [Limanda limanda]|uniref:uncharacterized protein LOC133020354 n=1 Tax=Limanda limanda TaxID=27771 RepID=UPI0029C65A72|nr:uncharacterized protein LOC133020354 [Limanda limanda]